MKALTLLPASIKKKYLINRCKTHISIHRPGYINIAFDDRFAIETNGVTYTIRNSKVSVSLWIDDFFTHTSVF